MRDQLASNPTGCLQVPPDQGRTSAAADGRNRRCQRGMTTAEYAVGTIATVSFAGILISILTDPTIRKLLMDLIVFLLKLFWPGAGA